MYPIRQLSKILIQFLNLLREFLNLPHDGGVVYFGHVRFSFPG